MRASRSTAADWIARTATARAPATDGGTIEVFHYMLAEHELGLPRTAFPGSREPAR